MLDCFVWCVLVYRLGLCVFVWFGLVFGVWSLAGCYCEFGGLRFKFGVLRLSWIALLFVGLLRRVVLLLFCWLVYLIVLGMHFFAPGWAGFSMF